MTMTTPVHSKTNACMSSVPILNLTSSGDGSSSGSSRGGGDAVGVGGRGDKVLSDEPVCGNVRKRAPSSCVEEKQESKLPAAPAPLLKKPKVEFLPEGFLDPLPPENDLLPLAASTLPDLGKPTDLSTHINTTSFRQFWKAGDYEGDPASSRMNPVGMDHVRVHPKFLHSNATSHKWALGAIAELLDNALDEAENGATRIDVDVLKNPKDGQPMVLFEDDGGGMTPNRMRQCMSFGYSAKSKLPNTIGQYGNGFKTSTMRLGADVIVFSKSPAKEGRKATQSVGMLSYSFLRGTGQEDIMVPMLDYEEDGVIKRLIRGTEEDFVKNLKTILQWGPYGSEQSLADQFKKIKRQGTRILVYNLWEDDQGHLELDFETDPHDIQVRGVRDDAKVLMVDKYPSTRHYFLYRHSLRIYASILYLRLPTGFKMMLRGKEIKHHSIVDDMMYLQEITYKPQGAQDSAVQGSNLFAVVTIGFVKDAADHVDVQGFNVYHKNRLIKPFWRIWNSASSQGRGVIGVLEANFVEPAHDKQGFERTTVLQRLESRLSHIQRSYWSKNCQKVGYQGTVSKRKSALALAHHSSEDEDPWEPRTARKRDRTQESLTFRDWLGTPSGKSTRSGRRSLKKNKEPVSDDSDDDETGLKEKKSSGKGTRKTKEPVSDDSDDDEGKKSCKKSKENGKEAGSSLRLKGLDNLGLEAVPSESPRPIVAIERFKELEEENHQLNARLMRLEEAENGRAEFEIAQKRDMEAQITRLEEELVQVQQGLLRERDSYKEALEEERRQHDIDDEEIRRQLKNALQRVRELEAENKQLVSQLR